MSPEGAEATLRARGQLTLNRRIFLSVFGTVFGVLLLSALGVTIGVGRQVEQLNRDLLDQAVTTLVELEQLDFESRRGRLERAVSSPQFKASLSLTDEATWEFFVRQLQSREQVDFLVVTDPRGTVLGSTLPGAPYRTSLAEDRLVAPALAGEPLDGIRFVDRQLHRVAAIPIQAGDHVLGSLLAGYRYRADLLDRFHRLTTMHVSLVAGRALVDTTLSPEEARDLHPVLEQFRSSAPAGEGLPPLSAALRGQHYLHAPAPIPGAGPDAAAFFVVHEPLRGIASFFGTLLDSFLWTSLGVVLLGLMVSLTVSFLLSVRITRPIEKMVDIAVSIARGDYSRTIETVPAVDEVGVLAAAFRRMQNNLNAIADRALEIARGDLSKQVEQEGTLAEAFNQMVVELRKSWERIAEDNRKLEEARNALWGEMQLAEKIQTALLPADLTAPGYDLAAAMVPADEVGGDYYDFVPGRDGRYWFAIGDVSGHGVSAGLVMMMTQCILNTLIERNPTLQPREAITFLNRVLYNNLSLRMGSEEFMTLSVLATNGTGDFVYSGAHEDMLVYRKEARACERIPVSGAWVGIMPDVSQSTNDARLSLHPGDVLLLYTDGLIEAMNGEGQQFDLERLSDRLAVHGERPAAEIRERLLEEVRSWMVDQQDDITLLLIKRETR